MQKVFDQLIKLSLREDLEPSGDLTTSLLFNNRNQSVYLGKEAKLTIFSRKQPGIFSGSRFVSRIFRILSPESLIKLNFLFKDTEKFEENQRLLEITGSPELVLQAERLFLNLLQRAISIATITNKFCQAIKHTKTKVLDTRKTTPGLRELEKQSVLDGGGFNHRFNLSTGILIKDNHIALAGGIDNLLEIIFSKSNQKSFPYLVNFAIEVDSLKQLEKILDYPFCVVLLDNFNLEELKEANKLRNSKNKKHLILEASGGINLDNIKDIAETGIDFVSVGKLTQNPELIDLGLDFVP